MYVPATESTDSFGHALHNLTKEETAARNAMQTTQIARVKAWGTDFTQVSPKKLKKMIREGVPKHLRTDLWLELSTANLLRQKYSSGHFSKLILRSAPKALFQDTEAAIFRCMPGHQFLATPAGLHAVVSIVHAYIQHNGFGVQNNIICISAFLVSVIGLEGVEDCFWILNGLMRHVLPATSADKDLSMTVSVECYVLSALLQKRCPKLLAALEAMDQSVYDISNRWFSHLFCGSLPAETTVRIWDCLMYEGPKVLFRVALALLKRQESIVAGNVQKLRNMDWRISRTFNADDLLKMAFNGIGSLPLAVIKRSREDVEVQMEKEWCSHAQRLEAILSPPKISPQSSMSSHRTELAAISENC